MNQNEWQILKVWRSSQFQRYWVRLRPRLARRVTCAFFYSNMFLSWGFYVAIRTCLVSSSRMVKEFAISKQQMFLSIFYCINDLWFFMTPEDKTHSKKLVCKMRLSLNIDEISNSFRLKSIFRTQHFDILLFFRIHVIITWHEKMFFSQNTCEEMTLKLTPAPQRVNRFFRFIIVVVIVSV